MSIGRSPVTYCARAKLLSLLDGKFGVFFKSHPLGSLEIHFLEHMLQGGWVLLETTPAVYVDEITFHQIGDEAAIDFDFQSQEFIIKKS